jgi:hypothetical protein
MRRDYALRHAATNLGLLGDEQLFLPLFWIFQAIAPAPMV